MKGARISGLNIFMNFMNCENKSFFSCTEIHEKKESKSISCREFNKRENLLKIEVILSAKN